MNQEDNKPLILIVDDTEMNIDILIELLSKYYDITVALDGKDALQIVQDEEIDLILLDIMMPDIDGFEVCKRLKSDESTSDIPVIFITAKTDEESIEKAYESGGIDFVTKPFKPKELIARVKTQIKIRKLIQELENSKEELKKLSVTDPMTGLYNRRYFSQVSEHIFHIHKRDKSPLGIMILDIDHFKNVNDTYGHHIGDEVIKYLAKSLQEFTRKSDIVCRFGGEEFMILLPETPIRGAKTIAEKIRINIQNTTLRYENDVEVKFTVSVGVSEVGNREKDVESAIERADKALYKAKNNGRNQVQFIEQETE